MDADVCCVTDDRFAIGNLLFVLSSISEKVLVFLFWDFPLASRHNRCEHAFCACVLNDWAEFQNGNPARNEGQTGTAFTLGETPLC
jgi:hypothetical protein